MMISPQMGENIAMYHAKQGDLPSLLRQISSMVATQSAREQRGQEASFTQPSLQLLPNPSSATETIHRMLKKFWSLDAPLNLEVHVQSYVDAHFAYVFPFTPAIKLYCHNTTIELTPTVVHIILAPGNFYPIKGEEVIVLTQPTNTNNSVESLSTTINKLSYYELKTLSQRFETVSLYASNRIVIELTRTNYSNNEIT